MIVGRGFRLLRGAGCRQGFGRLGIQSQQMTSAPADKDKHAQPSAAAVKELRAQSGAPMMDCKKALAASNSDVAKAMDWLRAKGIARASSSADRVALEGLVALHLEPNGQRATLIEVNSETDFVSRNKDFQHFCSVVAMTAAHFGKIDVTDLLQQPVYVPQGQGQGSTNNTHRTTVKDALGDVINLIRENIVIKRVHTVAVAAGAGCGGLLAGYVHGKVGGGGELGPVQLGKSVAVVELSSSTSTGGTDAALQSTGRRLAMHVVASKPLFLSEQTVPATVLDKETDICRQQLETADALKGKKPEVVDKIVRGKVVKRLGELCLLSQPHVAEEGAPIIGKFLTEKGLKCVSFERWTVGSA